jgi:hypothetical protein
MNQEQEIRAKALEIAIGLMRVLPEPTIINQLMAEMQQGKRPEDFVIMLSRSFETHITG